MEQRLKDHPQTREGVDLLTKKACDKLGWYNPFQVTGSDPKPETPPPATTTTWFKPSGIELHKWVIVKPSLLPGAGYGLFAEMEFQVGVTVSIYLGHVNTKVIQEVVKN